MSRHDYKCPQCLGQEGGCAWCGYTGRVSDNRHREIRTEDRQMSDDRDWGLERDRRSGAHFE